MTANSKFTCVIIEDELPASRIIELYVSNIAFLELRGTFTSATQALQLLNSETIDLLFLDINLPGISGINFVKSLNPAPAVIFTTAYPEYAVESFDLDAAVDYLLKPVSFERFIKAVNRFLKSRNAVITSETAENEVKEKPFIFIKSDKKMLKILLDDILFIEAQKNYLLIYTTHGEYRTHHSLGEMEERLPEQDFTRVHRSFIVALNKISSFNSNLIEIGSHKIPIGRHYLFLTSTLLKNLFQ